MGKKFIIIGYICFFVTVLTAIVSFFYIIFMDYGVIKWNDLLDNPMSYEIFQEKTIVKEEVVEDELKIEFIGEKMQKDGVIKYVYMVEEFDENITLDKKVVFSEQVTTTFLVTKTVQTIEYPERTKLNKEYFVSCISMVEDIKLHDQKKNETDIKNIIEESYSIYEKNYIEKKDELTKVSSIFLISVILLIFIIAIQIIKEKTTKYRREKSRGYL